MVRKCSAITLEYFKWKYLEIIILINPEPTENMKKLFLRVRLDSLQK